MRPIDINKDLLLKYCHTEMERQLVETVTKAGSFRKAEKILTLNRKTISKYINQIKSRIPENERDSNEVAPPEAQKLASLSRTTTLFDKDGNIKLQWVREEYRDASRAELFEEVIKNILSDLVEKRSSINAQTTQTIHSPADTVIDDEMCAYIIGDAHIGMRAWAPETGENYDLKIACEIHQKAIDHLVASAPATETAMLINVGDYTHVDDDTFLTPQNKNRLDADGRYQKIMRTALELAVYMIDQLLTKHHKVIVRNAIGNHDILTSQMISLYLDAWYRNNPRVEVSTEPTTFWYYQYGKNLIGVTHGDSVKLNELPLLMAADQADKWSSTKYRYWLTGHIHHETVKELNVCTVMSFGTLAAKDAYHISHGYRAHRKMKMLIFNKNYGIVQENSVNIDMLQISELDTCDV